MTFEEWLKSFPWLHERDLPCIVSADLDGIACGLLQQHVLNWSVVGTYDGVTLCLARQPSEINWTKVVFLDVEILRPSIRSVGNHLFALDAEDAKRLARDLPNCANPNLWREMNIRATFQSKYPFGTLPLLLASQSIRSEKFEVSQAWMALALHTDSAFTNAATYQQNALNWLNLMGDGAGDGLERFCRLLARLPVQKALVLLQEVQSWASESGFGKLQRSCQFDASLVHERELAARLIDRLRLELKIEARPPISDAPVYVEKFRTLKTSLSAAKFRQAAAIQTAMAERVISMAATTLDPKKDGLSATLPNPNSPIELSR